MIVIIYNHGRIRLILNNNSDKEWHAYDNNKSINSMNDDNADSN